MHIVMISVPSRESGAEAMDRIDGAVDEGRISVQDVAMAYKTKRGKVRVQQTGDATAGKGAWKGGALGLLVGVFAAPLVPAVAVGAGLGAVIGGARDRGISDKLMKQAAHAIQNSEAVVFVLADESSTGTITEMVEDAIDGGADVAYEVLPEEAQDFLREAIKLADAQ